MSVFNPQQIDVNSVMPSQLLAMQKEKEQRVSTFYRDLFTSTQAFNDQTYIALELLKQKVPVIAPYANQRKAGMPVWQLDKSGKRFRVAESKLSDEIPDRVMFEQGMSEAESIMGLPTLSPEGRIAARVKEVVLQQSDAFDRRHNLHAARMLRNARDVMNYATGEQQQIDLGRDAGNTVDVVWKAGSGNSTVSDTFQALLDHLNDLPTGAMPSDVVLSPYLFGIMAQNDYFKAWRDQQNPLITNRGVDPMLRVPATVEPQNVGQIMIAGGTAMNLWVDGTSYLDVDGTKKCFNPKNEVFLFDRNSTDGTRCYARTSEAKLGFSNLPKQFYDTGYVWNGAMETSSRKIIGYSKFLYLPQNTNGTALMRVTVQQ